MATMAYEGIRVIDFTLMQQGPSGTQLLADFGADVIKVEPMGTGARGRQGQPRVNDVSVYFAANNRNKRSISLDLKKPEGREIIHRLVKVSDVVASNFRPGVMERLGLGFDDLSQINPGIICAYASGYGRTGPYRNKQGQDVIAQAMGGLMALTGERDGPPAACGTYISDYLGAMHFAMGIAFALAARERTGKGQMVDTCLLNSTIACHLQEGAAYLNTGLVYPRPLRGNAHWGYGPLYGNYQTQDGKWLAVVGLFADEAWKKVCAAVGIEGAIAEDPQLKTRTGLAEREAELIPLLAEAFKKFSRDEALRRLEEQGVLASPVYEYPEVFTDPQVIHNEIIWETEHPVAGKLKLVGPPIKLSDTPGTLRMSPPVVGQHNQDVLSELSYSPEEIQALRDKGVVGSEDLLVPAGKEA